MIDVTAVQQNIFPGAHDAVWQAFSWHKGAASPRSSQALAVSVFGTVATHPARQVLIDEMARSMFQWETRPGGDWRVRLEAVLPHGLLGERRPTQVDVLLENGTSIIMLECKFNEAGGSCSQTDALSAGKHEGLIQCDGSYRLQKNPVNGKEARCALSAKGVRYWGLVPKYFDWTDDRDYEPCPFAGPAFQYMRNTLAAACWAEQHKSKRAAFGLVYAKGEHFPMSREVAEPASEWNQFLGHLQPGALLTVKAASYQDILACWRRCLPQDRSLLNLAEWVADRVMAQKGNA